MAKKKYIYASFGLLLIFLVSPAVSISAEDWLSSMLLDPVLSTAGIYPSSDAATISKKFGTTWLNPSASDMEIQQDIEHIRNYVLENDKEDALRSIYTDKTLSPEDKRIKIEALLDGVKICPSCGGNFPINYRYCPYDGEPLAYPSAEETELSGFAFASAILKEYTGGVEIGMSMPDARGCIEDLVSSNVFGNASYCWTEEYPVRMIRVWADGKVNAIEYMHYEEADGYSVYNKVSGEARRRMGNPDKIGGSNSLKWILQYQGSGYTFEVFWVTSGGKYCGIRLKKN